MVIKEKIRKGPWTEQEDLQLVWFVRLFGERRWDFLAKVSGLNRTGKSCRLRWVNYLHPSLKHGRMTPQEEQLIVDLHKKWGNRWSKIAGELPGRTDNEIKNYWRTHTRKKAQEEKASLLSSSSSTSNNDEAQLTSIEQFENEASMQGCLEEKIGHEKDATIDMASELIFEEYEDIGCYNDGNGVCSTWPSPVWEYNPEPLWMDG